MTIKSKTHSIKSVAELQGLAISLLKQGARVFYLNGQLGAGKTTCVRGLAKTLGWSGTVQSPTFTLMKEYPVSAAAWNKKFTSLVHIDLYRLQDEINPLPIEEWVMNPNIIVAIEWPEKMWHVSGAVEINIKVAADEIRRVSVIPLSVE